MKITLGISISFIAGMVTFLHGALQPAVAALAANIR